MNVEGKVALITGAGTGVGRATAEQLAALGCRVAVNYCRSEEAARETVAGIESAGGQAIICQGDVAQQSAAYKLVEQAKEQFGRLDILVNNAGTTSFIPFDDFSSATDEVWQRIMSVNVLGPFHCVTAAAELMRSTAKPDGAEIVNVSSVAGLLGTGSSIPYCASKAALNILTVALSRTLAPEIRVNAVAPGFISGRWLQEGLADRYEAIKGAFEDAMPLEKVCAPADVARAIVSLITGSDLITGQVLPCDAGMTVMNPVSI